MKNYTLFLFLLVLFIPFTVSATESLEYTEHSAIWGSSGTSTPWISIDSSGFNATYKNVKRFNVRFSSGVNGNETIDFYQGGTFIETLTGEVSSPLNAFQNSENIEFTLTDSVDCSTNDCWVTNFTLDGSSSANQFFWVNVACDGVFCADQGGALQNVYGRIWGDDEVPLTYTEVYKNNSIGTYTQIDDDEFVEIIVDETQSGDLYDWVLVHLCYVSSATDLRVTSYVNNVATDSRLYDASSIKSWSENLNMDSCNNSYYFGFPVLSQYSYSSGDVYKMRIQAEGGSYKVLLAGDDDYSNVYHQFKNESRQDNELTFQILSDNPTTTNATGNIFDGYVDINAPIDGIASTSVIVDYDYLNPGSIDYDTIVSEISLRPFGNVISSNVNIIDQSNDDIETNFTWDTGDIFEVEGLYKIEVCMTIAGLGSFAPERCDSDQFWISTTTEQQSYYDVLYGNATTSTRSDLDEAFGNCRTSTSTTCSIGNLTGCFLRAMCFSFVPSPQSLEDLVDNVTLASTTFPIGYWTIFKNSFENVANGTTTSFGSLTVDMRQHGEVEVIDLSGVSSTAISQLEDNETISTIMATVTTFIAIIYLVNAGIRVTEGRVLVSEQVDRDIVQRRKKLGINSFRR